MSEAVSRTTFGGCTLDDLHRGSKNYICDASCLVNLVGKDRNEAKEKLKHKLGELFQDLELQTERRVKKYYIGKTLINQRKRPNSKKFVKFDPMDPYTWKKNGISSRWGCHRNTEYGRDGLVVLAAVPKDAVPQQCRQEVHQEQYALALEQMLLHHYKLDIGDQRLHNETFTSGGPDGGKSIAYAVYVAFTLEEQTEEDNNEYDSTHPETCQPNEEQTTSGELSSSYLVNQAQETSIDVPVIVNTSTSSVLNQPLEEQISLSDNDRFVIRPPQLELDEVTDLQATNYILHRPSSVTFEQVLMEESTRDQLLLGEIDETVCNNSLIGKSILSNKEQVPETVSHLSSLKPVTTSGLTMLRQHNKEESSSSENDTLLSPPQLDKMRSHQSTNCISSLQRTKPNNEQHSLCNNNALVIDSMNSHKLDLKKVAEPQLHERTTLQCPPSLQLKYLTMLQSVRNQLLLEKISCHPLLKQKTYLHLQILLV